VQALSPVWAEAGETVLTTSGYGGYLIGEDGETQSEPLFYLCESGALDVLTSEGVDGRAKTAVFTLRPGSCAGWLDRLYGCPSDTEVLAVEDTELWAIDIAELHRLGVLRHIMDRRREIEDLLVYVSLFNILAEYQRFFLADLLEEERFSAGSYICRQGEFGDRFFILVQGSAEATIRFGAQEEDETVTGSEEGDEVVVATYLRGGYFGELSLMRDGASRAASVRAVTDVTALSLRRDRFVTTFLELEGVQARLEERMRELDALRRQTEAERKLAAAAAGEGEEEEEETERSLLSSPARTPFVQALSAYGGSATPGSATKRSGATRSDAPPAANTISGGSLGGSRDSGGAAYDKRMELARRSGQLVRPSDGERLELQAAVEASLAFEGLPSEAAELASMVLERVELDRGEVLVWEGELVPALFVVAQGDVQALRTPPDLRGRADELTSEELLHVSMSAGLITPGELIGEVPLIFNSPADATLAADMGGVVLWALSAERFRRLTGRLTHVGRERGISFKGPQTREETGALRRLDEQRRQQQQYATLRKINGVPEPRRRKGQMLMDDLLKAVGIDKSLFASVVKKAAQSPGANLAAIAAAVDKNIAYEMQARAAANTNKQPERKPTERTLPDAQVREEQRRTISGGVFGESPESSAPSSPYFSPWRFDTKLDFVDHSGTPLRSARSLAPPLSHRAGTLPTLVEETLSGASHALSTMSDQQSSLLVPYYAPPA